MNWKQELTHWFTKYHKISILGVGSVLCGDDAAGMLLIDALIGKKLPENRIQLLAGSTAPENFSGVIKAFSPDLLLIVDAVFCHKPIGEIHIIDQQAIGGADFSTHMLPLPILMQYLQQETGTETKILGVQPGQTEFATEPCQTIRQAVEELANHIATLVH